MDWPSSPGLTLRRSLGGQPPCNVLPSKNPARVVPAIGLPVPMFVLFVARLGCGKNGSTSSSIVPPPVLSGLLLPGSVDGMAEAISWTTFPSPRAMTRFSPANSKSTWMHTIMTTPSPSPQSEAGESLVLRGPKVLLQGPTGTGKTTALGTAAQWYADRGWHVYALFTENSTEVFRGWWTDKGKPVPPTVHIMDILVKPNSLKALIDGADKVGKLTYDSLCKLIDPNRSGDNNAYWKILKQCADFTDSVSGETFGTLEEFPTNSLFIMDSLSETANAAMKMQIGNLPVANKPDYMVAQNNLINFIRLLCQGVKCSVIITAHIDRLTDEISGGTRITARSIGQALAGQIPQLFSDVIMTCRSGTEWYWDTADTRADLKTRNLPVHAKLPPDFSPLLDRWYSRARAGEKE